MSAAAAQLCTLTLAIAVAALSDPVQCYDETKGGICSGATDELRTDYDADCRVYARCVDGEERARYSCSAGRAFNAEEGRCMPRRDRPCVRHACAPSDAAAYSAPGTACTRYYTCENGTARERTCPPDARFDYARQACSRAAGACYEPVCAGRHDGKYPDVSHDCRREVHCVGGAVRAVVSTSPTLPCPPPRALSAALPVGIDDDRRLEVCRTLADGVYPDPTTTCTEYFACLEGKVVRRGSCVEEPECAAFEIECPSPAPGRCFGRADGHHRDYVDCSSWFECRRERVASRGRCDEGLVWNGADCVPPSYFFCRGPRTAVECALRPPGLYPDLSLQSNCTRYFHCDRGLRVDFECDRGQTFDGSSCVPSDEYLCPSLEPDSCELRPDGKYSQSGGGCRAYYACYSGTKAVFVCDSKLAFDGHSCVPVSSFRCPHVEACAGRADGTYPAARSGVTGCREYFECRRGAALGPLRCPARKVYDGRSCVPGDDRECRRKLPTRT